MKVVNKENQQKKITIYLDSKQHKKFFNKILEISKEFVYKSNPKKLNYTVVFNSVRVPYVDCGGIVSRVIDRDGRITHAGFFDWDNILESVLLDEVRYLSTLVDSPIFIFSTSEKKDINNENYGNYIGICLLKKPFFDWVQIHKLLHTDTAHAFVAMTYRYKAFVLRMSGKKLKPEPKFKYIIDNGKKDFKGEISNAHKEFLEGYYPKIKELLKEYNFNLDKNSIQNLTFTKYKTAST